MIPAMMIEDYQNLIVGLKSFFVFDASINSIETA
ncbi:MAG: hypothetical protein ACI9Z4_001004 [Polaribacter sp.]|jgi:hypothetical protein